MAERLTEIDKVADLLDRLRLDAPARARGVVVVEGPVDAAVITEIFADEGVAAFPVSGRNNVLRVADHLAEDYLEGIVCLADTDFDDEPVRREDQWFLVFTDGADLEAMILSSPALDRVIETWGTEAKIAAFGGVSRLRDLIGETARPLAILRRQNALRQLGIAFDEVNLYDVVSPDDLQIKLTKLVTRLAAASPVEAAEIRALLESEPGTCPYTRQVLIRGRDFLVIVDVALRKLVGNCSHQKVKDGLARPSLMLAVRASDLADTPFVLRLREALERASRPEAA